MRTILLLSLSGAQNPEQVKAMNVSKVDQLQNPMEKTHKETAESDARVQSRHQENRDSRPHIAPVRCTNNSHQIKL